MHQEDLYCQSSKYYRMAMHVEYSIVCKLPVYTYMGCPSVVVCISQISR